MVVYTAEFSYISCPERQIGIYTAFAVQYVNICRTAGVPVLPHSDPEVLPWIAPSAVLRSPPLPLLAPSAVLSSLHPLPISSLLAPAFRMAVIP